MSVNRVSVGHRGQNVSNEKVFCDCRKSENQKSIVASYIATFS